MTKKITGYLKLQVKGGEAKPAPPVGPALGSKGLNIMEFCKQFNARTQDQPGELLPVLLTIYQDKSFDFVIKTPPTTAVIMKKAGIKKGSSEPNRVKVGAMTWDEVQEIAALKMPDLNTLELQAAMKMIAGTARSMGVNVQGKAPWTN
ncbi:MAG: 50S ribosomal protein L11 [Bacteroidota bacterium]